MLVHACTWFEMMGITNVGAQAQLDHRSRRKAREPRPARRSTPICAGCTRAGWSRQVIPSSATYQDTLQHVTNYFVSQGSSLLQAHDQAIQWIGAQVQSQASYLAYMDAFWVLMLISLSAVPLALMLRKVKLGGPVH